MQSVKLVTFGFNKTASVIDMGNRFFQCKYRYSHVSGLAKGQAKRQREETTHFDSVVSPISEQMNKLFILLLYSPIDASLYVLNRHTTPNSAQLKSFRILYQYKIRCFSYEVKLYEKKRKLIHQQPIQGDLSSKGQINQMSPMPVD